MSKLIQDLLTNREKTQALSDQLNEKVEHTLLLLLQLANKEKYAKWESSDLWWWYGMDEDRPFRRGDRHGYFYSSGDSIDIFLDEPYDTIPGFDSHVSTGSHKYSCEKLIPTKYLEMSDQDIISDATIVMTEAINANNQAQLDAKNKDKAISDARSAVLGKLTDEEKRVLGFKYE